jgi:hypothetical protein
MDKIKTLPLFELPAIYGNQEIEKIQLTREIICKTMEFFINKCHEYLISKPKKEKNPKMKQKFLYILITNDKYKMELKLTVQTNGEKEKKVKIKIASRFEQKIFMDMRNSITQNLVFTEIANKFEDIEKPFISLIKSGITEKDKRHSKNKKKPNRNPISITKMM